MGKLNNLTRYNAQEHTVTTDDGYILKMFRVTPLDANDESLKNRKVVLCMHGLFVRYFNYRIQVMDGLQILKI